VLIIQHNLTKFKLLLSQNAILGEKKLAQPYTTFIMSFKLDFDILYLIAGYNYILNLILLLDRYV
jgi:hypothetical protein